MRSRRWTGNPVRHYEKRRCRQSHAEGEKARMQSLEEASKPRSKISGFPPERWENEFLQGRPLTGWYWIGQHQQPPSLLKPHFPGVLEPLPASSPCRHCLPLPLAKGSSARRPPDSLHPLPPAQLQGLLSEELSLQHPTSSVSLTVHTVAPDSHLRNIVRCTLAYHHCLATLLLRT